MANALLFISLPESETPSTSWTMLNDELLDRSTVEQYLFELSNAFSILHHEVYVGKYDSRNVRSFLENFNVLEDCYPSPIRNLLRKIFSEFDFSDIRETIEFTNNCKLYNQDVADSPLYAIASLLPNCRDHNFLIYNHAALKLGGNRITVSYDNEPFSIDIASNDVMLSLWFSENRYPRRVFHDTDKHRAKNQGNWDNASPLLCSISEGQQLLNSAVGLKGSTTLFNFDTKHNYIIQFMNDNVAYEGEVYYHGYHLVDLRQNQECSIPVAILEKSRVK